MNKRFYKIGDVVWAQLHGNHHVQKGVRPVVIIQNNTGNQFSPTVEVMPLTSRCTKKRLPTHVFVPAGIAGLPKDSIVQCESARTIDKQDILGHIGEMPRDYMAQISWATMISIPLIQYLTAEQVNTIHRQVTDMPS